MRCGAERNRCHRFANKPVIYDILFRAAAKTMRTIAADPAHLGAEIGFLSMLHTWGQNLLHQPLDPATGAQWTTPFG
jgi:hypothetical protein